MVDRAWISIVAAVGSYAVALLCIYVGYELFMAGATGAFKFEAGSAAGSVGLESLAPGIIFGLFGAAVAIWATYRLLPH